MEKRTGGSDLHIHTTSSDGTRTVYETIQDAVAFGLSHIAITDHNQFAVLQPSIYQGLEIIPGAEFSTDHQGKELHVVGLFIKEDCFQKVRDFCEDVRKSKENSNRMLIENLKQVGYHVEYEELVNYAHSDNINRAVIAGYLM